MQASEALFLLTEMTIKPSDHPLFLLCSLDALFLFDRFLGFPLELLIAVAFSRRDLGFLASVMDAQRALLDELMGAARNLTEEQKKRYKEIRWDDKEVCGAYMVRFCPHDLFVNTKSDLGACPKIHDPKLKESFEKSPRHDAYVPRFEAELAQFCEKLVMDLDRKVKRGRDRLAQEVDATPTPVPVEKSEQLSVLEEKIKKLLEQIETLGESGKVDEAEALMRKVDMLNAEKTALTQQSANDKAMMLPQEKKMALCEICGSFLVANDAAERTQTHVSGKQHIGYGMVRDYLSEFKAAKEKAKEEERLAREKETEERRKVKDKDHENRVRERDQVGRERSREQERERERDRYKDRSSERERSRDWSGRGSRDGGRGLDRRHDYHRNGRESDRDRFRDRVDGSVLSRSCGERDRAARFWGSRWSVSVGKWLGFLRMAVNYLCLSAFSTAVGLVGLQWWTVSSLDRMRSDGLFVGDGHGVSLESAQRALELLLSSHVTVALLVNFVINVYVLVVLLLKTLFFVQLNASETRKVLEGFVNYILYKGAFLLLVVPPNISQVIIWSSWLIFLGFLKIFQSLARDRLERLNASPSVTPLKYFRVFSALLMVLSADFLLMKLCMIYSSHSSSLFMLLFFEPLCIAFETFQIFTSCAFKVGSFMAIMVHGFQLLEICQGHSDKSAADCSAESNIQKTAAGSLSEWKGIFIRHCGFILDMFTLAMVLGHYLMTWWLHGMAFHLVDIILFLNSRALLSAIMKRSKTYINLWKSLSSLDGALPDASYEELCAYDDECAICRGPMARAKKLWCNHLFHLVCLRSWLDQGLTEMYSCPTCWRPLFVSSPRGHTRSISGNGTDDPQLPEYLNLGMNLQTVPDHAPPLGASPNQQQNASDTIWRVAASDSSLAPPVANQGMAGASRSSSVRPVGYGGVQMMMRQLASVSENYAHGSLDDDAWNPWPSQHTPMPSLPSPSSLRMNRNATGLRIRNTSPSVNNMSELLTMVDRVREVLPHIPDEFIVQDLLRTNNMDITVINLMQ
ncbi:hypothetical protein MUK42_10700 [Musa troglodytarum]|uniref:E3 ubiquitin protein ligase RIN2 n=1 Tax=Musa troglodytarum TaxID=320322 RepID=A0A9E7KN71_9LILI|nr:hypothetical protein MUK42_10700 [Musa troglodytarum]